MSTLVSYNQSRVYIRPTKNRQSIIKVYRDTVHLPSQTIELLAMSPVFEVDETKVRLKNVQVEEKFTSDEPRITSSNMVKYPMKGVNIQENVITDITFYYQYPTIDYDQQQFVRLDHEKQMVYLYDREGANIESETPFTPDVAFSEDAFEISLMLLRGIPVYTEFTHTFEAYSVRDGFQRMRGITYHGPQPSLAPKPVLTYEIKGESIASQTEIPYMELEVHQPLTVDEVYLVYANQEKVFVEVGDANEHLHEDVYRYIKKGGTYQSVLHHYRAIAFSEEGISLHSNPTEVELFCDPENLTNTLDIYEDGRWVSVRNLEPNTPHMIGHPIYAEEGFDALLRPEDKQLNPNEINVDLSAIGRNKISLTFPNLFNQVHEANHRDSFLFRVSAHYLHLDQSSSEIFHFGTQYIPIERILIYRTFDHNEDVTSRKPDYELIRDGGIYYLPHVHQDLVKDLEVIFEPVSIFSAANYRERIELQDIVAPGKPVRYTFVLQDALGVKHPATHYDVNF